jgi:A/G-specific adenine glycosylase
MADALTPPGAAWAHNQAMLDLGATVCTARRPDCSRCPLAAHGACAWRLRGGPDPAVGSAGATRPQSRFEGSDRQGRGRLVAALQAGPVSPAALAAAAGWPEDPVRAQRVASGLVADGLARITADGDLAYPDGGCRRR